MQLYITTNFIKSNARLTLKVNLLVHTLFPDASSVAHTRFGAIQRVVSLGCSEKDPGIAPLPLIELQDMLVAVQSVLHFCGHNTVIR
jgi:hypothetical protein